jgi:S-adenosyl-L-methionine hydrolase (adenosine-forming)
MGFGSVPAMNRRYEHVTLLTDLGDEGAGLLRAVLADRAGGVSVIDLSHGVAPYDVRAGSLALARAVQYLPDGVVIAAVDSAGSRPAVAIAVAGGNGVLLGPDNGLLAPAVALAGGAERAVYISGDVVAPSPGSIHMARDVLAPAAAHLCNGGSFTDLGPAVDAGVLLPGLVPIAREEDGAVVAEVVWIDNFGNVQLNVGVDDLSGWPATIRLSWAGDNVRSASRTESFADLSPGIHLVLDSYGMFAIAVTRHSAAEELSLAVGTEVRLSPGEAGSSSPVTLRRKV